MYVFICRLQKYPPNKAPPSFCVCLTLTECMQMKYGLLLFHDSIFLTENLAFLLDSDPLILLKSGIITIYLFILGPLSSYSMVTFNMNSFRQMKIVALHL